MGTRIEFSLMKGALAMKKNEMSRMEFSSIIHIFLFILSMICLIPAGNAQAVDEKKPETYTIMDVKGDVLWRASEDTLVRPVEVNGNVLSTYILEMKEGSSLKLKESSGGEVVLQGAMKGTVGGLVAATRSETSDFVKRTLSKIPTAKDGEKKIDISTPSAGLTRAAKAQKKPMPYIWKVKQTEKKPESK
jgi:hypothetical protein